MDADNPSRQSLATGFRNVDTSGDTGACTRCLDLIAGIPFFQEVKRDSIRIIAESGAGSVLDAGCGAGIDLPGLLDALPGHTRVVGLDASTALISRARVRIMGSATRCSLVKGDLLQIPLRDKTFDACRIDRVLQHIHDPSRAVGNLCRILALGGILVAFDNDWNTLTVPLDDRVIAHRIRRSWCGSFASGRIGQDLPALFAKCGLTGIHTEERRLSLHDLRTAEQVFDLPHLFGRMVQEGTITPEERSAIRDELTIRSQEGTFTAGYSGYLVSGIREM